jgi:hypothetical protein
MHSCGYCQQIFASKSQLMEHTTVPLPVEYARSVLLERKISIDTRENTTMTASFHVANADCCTDDMITCIAI